LKTTKLWLTLGLLITLVVFTGSQAGSDDKKGKIEVELAGTSPAEKGLTVDLPCGAEPIEGWRSGDDLGYDVEVELSADGKCRPYVSHAGTKNYEKVAKLKNVKSLYFGCIKSEGGGSCHFKITRVVRAGYRGEQKDETQVFKQKCGSGKLGVSYSANDITILSLSKCPVSVFVDRRDGVNLKKLVLKSGESVTVHSTDEKVTPSCGIEPTDQECEIQVMLIQSHKP